jgi:hypothetical protein
MACAAPASLTHFLTNEVLAAPANLFSAALASHDAAAGYCAKADAPMNAARMNAMDLVMVNSR